MAGTWSIATARERAFVTLQHETLVDVQVDETGHWYTIRLRCDLHDELTFTVHVTHLPSMARVSAELCERLGIVVDSKMTLIEVTNAEGQRQVDRVAEGLRQRRRRH